MKDCLLVCVKCLGFLLLLPFAVVLILFVGPLIYYRGTVFNSDALAQKYRKEGVRLQGQVIARWKKNGGEKSGPTFHVRVVYRVGQDRYVKNDMVVNQGLYSEQNLDLIRLPHYRKSAILFARVEGVDPDFPPSKLPNLFFAFFWMFLWNFIPIHIILTSIEACDFCTNLIGPVFCGMIALELLVGYWVAKLERDSDLKSTLYGAKRVSRSNDDTGAADDATPKYVSYGSFFDEGKHSFFSVISNIVLDLTTVVAWIGFAIYFLIFGGGYMLMDSLVMARWREKILQKILQRYESESTQVVGSVVCRQGQTLIVQYEVDAHVYKKRLIVPSHMVRTGCLHHRHESETVPDDPDILYLTDNPASATLKCQIDNPQHEKERFRKKICGGIFVMIIQLGFATLFIGIPILIQQENFDQTSGNPFGTQLFMLLPGILLACHIIFGCICAYIHYEFFFKRELLWGAKRVFPRAIENDEVLLDEEQELDVAVSLGQGWDELNITHSTTDDSVESRSLFTTL